MRIDELDDFEGLVRHGADEGQHLAVGDILTVRILDADPSQRRIKMDLASDWKHARTG